jgi:hypothetical protein
MSPRAHLDAVVKRNIPSPLWESKPRTPDRPARSLFAILTKLSRFLLTIIPNTILNVSQMTADHGTFPRYYCLHSVIISHSHLFTK